MTTKELKSFLEKEDFSVYLFEQDNMQCAEIEKWTNEGVDMSFILMPFSKEKFVEYVNGFDIDLIFPEKLTGSFNVGYSEELPKNFKLPNEIDSYLDLSCLKKLPENFKFPNKIGDDLFMESLKEIPESVELPKEIGGNLYLNEQIKLSDEQKKYIKEHNISVACW